jgi:hypothetical protein
MKPTTTIVLLTSLLAPFASAAEPSPTAATGTSGALLAEAIKGPLADVEELLFIVSRPFGGSFNPFDAPSRDRPEKLKESRTGGRLCKLHLRTGKVTVLLEDPASEMRDGCVHYDGRKALFSYGKGTTGLHLYEINVDGTGLKRLTPDDAEEDVSPSYLPDGDIVFASTRSHRFVGCSGGYATTIYYIAAEVIPRGVPTEDQGHG